MINTSVICSYLSYEIILYDDNIMNLNPLHISIFYDNTHNVICTHSLIIINTKKTCLQEFLEILKQTLIVSG